MDSGTLLLISLGTNSGGPGRLAEAIDALRKLFGEVTATPPEETPPLDGTGPNYFNCVAMAHTILSPLEVKQYLRHIESSLGRDRSTPDVVAIDLDLLLYGNLVDASFKLPSPDLVERSFCLLPAVKLAPDFIHPTLGYSLATLARQRKTT
ncbi:MAG: 2-amino-4-hydroxy-6-hydroxymethyldihydropteridine diphosphokinase [Victivallales bacterium]|nr:2-amino-4-hydroxy-6-hydroxymethyldihydropteridine diphosphokinase [Victivallales bacterium]